MGRGVLAPEKLLHGFWSESLAPWVSNACVPFPSRNPALVGSLQL